MAVGGQSGSVALRYGLVALRSALPADRGRRVPGSGVRRAMAHFHVHVRPGPKGAGAEHAQYIAREGRFKAEKYGEIGEKASGNLPAWARGSAARFFAAADDHERANGNSYREFELALPKELSDAERGKLVRELVAEQIGDKHAYAWAIHEPRGHNPHVHIMFSERLRDGIERGPEQYFKRANTKQPERGGQLKSDWFTGRGGPQAVESLRARWAEMQNQALERAGVAARVDHRSLAAQGIEREAGQHRGPAVSGVEARGEVAEVSARREAERAERAQARAAVEAEVKIVTREEVALERVAVRERRELAKEAMGEDRDLVLPRIEADRREQLGRVQALAERRVERRQGLGGRVGQKLLMQARALRERIGQELTRVKEWVREKFPDPLQRLKARSREVFGAIGRGRARPRSEATPDARMDARAEKSPPAERVREAESRVAPAARESATRQAEVVRERERLASLSSRELWAEINKIRPPSVDRLLELDPNVAGARTLVESHQLKAAQALEAANRVAAEGNAWRHAHGVQAALHDRGMKTAAYLVEREMAVAHAKRVRADALKAAGLAQAEFARARAEAQPRIIQETAPARAKVEELRELASAASQREDVAAAFERLAREAARLRDRDASADWKATPTVLRDAIERYNRQTPEVQRGILKAIASRPEAARTLEEAIEKRREQVHDRGHGHGR